MGSLLSTYAEDHGLCPWGSIPGMREVTPPIEGWEAINEASNVLSRKGREGASL
jgi:hypothetical protein